MTLSPFSERVRRAFGRRVASYEPMAPLQRSMAWRLAGVAAHQRAGSALALPAGPCADLGAGTGLVGRALAAWRFPLPAPLGQLDLCPESLARNGAGPTLPWDLNQGLPPHLRGAALLTSSFALQWLEAPAAALAHWGDHLAPGGWLLLAVPTAGSFPEWRLAARRTGLPCSALPLPAADTLLAAATLAGLEVLRARVLTFSGHGWRSGPRAGPGGGSAHPALGALRALRAIGADATPQGTSLAPGAWRQLLAAWPAGGHLSWEVLLLLARKSPAAAPAPGGLP
ncbi:MAG: methyltransferase domain-containing protein [Cyanobacteriota bacterium]|nr:methyltransferase domain-containing protein [Cyanobacteriota bacterium]